MPAQRPRRPLTRQHQTAPVNGAEVTSFALRQVSNVAQRAADQLRDRVVLQRDLIVGDTVINHELGRTPSGVTITPSVASATWAWAIKSRSQTQLTITCVGVAQPGAILEVF
jgi:hypothetical protein